ncbi:MAG TPA: MBL fold metallo-hydrolase [Gemmataceae bacterium]|nr:MBL fold metallo-hydrolase [Gemmataceae bacterium]
MWKKLFFALVAAVLMPGLGNGQDPKAVLDGVAKSMGDVKSLQYAASGANYAFGQNAAPDTPWPRFNLKSFTRTVDYDAPAMRDEIVRTQAEPGARGGGGIPLVGEQRQIQAVSGTYAWNQIGELAAAPALAAAGDRLHQLWITPHGVIKAAMKYNATVETQTEGGKKMTVISFAVPGQLKVKAFVNQRNLVDKVESWSTNPVLGDVLTETTYADYKDFGGVQFPTKITQKQGGFPTLDLTVSEVKANVPTDIQAPDNVRQASVKVQTDKVADGVWYLTGGTHHSVLVEMNDHLVVIEGPQNDARALALIDEVKKTVPNKPIKYVINTHHHFDHAGGLGPFVAEGATIITHDANKAFLEKSLAAPRTVQPDKLAQSGKKATVEGMQDKRVLSDGTRTLELYLIQGTIHDDGIIMAYLPKEKLLVEADVYTPAAPTAAPPAQPNPLHVNLYDNLERLKLTVDQILPIHGRKVPLSELQKWIGKSS